MTTITIVTACFNNEKTIADTLKSVRAQTFVGIEHVIIDGASTDKTMEVVSEEGEHVSKCISEPDAGIYDALNKGIALATGDIIGFLHADDMLAYNGAISDIVAAFSDASVCAVYGDLQYISRNNPSKVVRTWRSSSYEFGSLKKGWMVAHPTFYVRREWYSRIGGFDREYKISADYLSMLRLFGCKDFHALYLPKVLVKMRLGGASNKSIPALIRKLREDWFSLRLVGFTYLQSLLALIWKNLGKLHQFFVH